ncbi:related to Cytochrome P450 4F8 [Sporisorium reilianum f. sp. reilianum]|uniref:Related to Cytochrome P450 4F8 n=1 Tax=Sporisorium reilianum f. sp. reilianum TaxID=72559 RepID=A0A2N8U5D2_9BASI|nr:related to Cytochrome P450 4F8 [Sporisorium reilianum f. sp. reilianum]
MTTTLSDKVLRWASSHPILAGLFALVLITTLYLGWKEATRGPSVWANLPGPERTSFFVGYSRDAKKKMGVKDPRAEDREPIIGDDGADITDTPGVSTARLYDEYACDHLVFPRPLGGDLLITRDAATMNHILSDSYTYQRSAAGTKATKLIIGDGVVAVFGDEHKKQRRMLAPAFSVESLKALMPVFTEATNKMMRRFEQDTSLEQRWGKDVKDSVKWFGRVTLDIIGHAGFDYDFGAVEQGPNGLAVRSTFHDAMTSTMNVSPIDAVVGAFMFFVVPSLLYILPLTENVRKLREMRSELIKVSHKIVARKAKQIRAELEAGVDAKETFAGKKDILHLLMRANMSPEIRPKERLSDETLAGQIVTFIFAGHETTATTMSWCTFFLSLNAAYQQQLRTHLQTALREMGRDGESIEQLTWGELNSDAMRPLDQCIQETLRLRPPVMTTFRYATKDDTLPVTTPFKTNDGRTLASIPITAGKEIAISVTGNNLDPKYFGADPHRFHPHRWNSLPTLHTSSKLPSPFGSFVFNGGPKVCIGNKFAMTEMKIILIRVLAKYRIEPVDGLRYKSVEAVVQRPAVIGFEKEGSQLPLRFVKDPL